MRHYMVETPSSYRKSISCVKPWSDRSWTTWRHSAEMRWDKTGNTKKHVQNRLAGYADDVWLFPEVWYNDLSLQQSIRRQGVLAFSLFGVLLAHGDLRNNKLSQLSVNLWNLSHKHGYCETRMSVSSPTLIIRDCQLGQDSCVDPLASAPGSDAGEHQTAGPATWHDPPNRRGPETGSAVPHLNFSLMSRTCDHREKEKKNALLCVLGGK